MQVISRDELLNKIESNDDFVLIEVLDPASYEAFHLPGAMNIPLGDDFEDRVTHAIPDKSRPVVVYCKDESCTASPKAASRLERLGYAKVYDYSAGKLDWRRAGLHVDTSAPVSRQAWEAPS